MSTTITTTTKNSIEKKQTYKWDIVWFNVFLLAILHIIFAYSIYVRYTEVQFSATVLFVKTVSYIAGFGITAGAHRLWTHRSYKAKLPLQIMLMFMYSVVYQNSIYNWVRDHRVHHKFSETDADPHNAKRGLFFSHVGWLLVRKHPDVTEKGKLVDMSDLESDKLIMFHHKYYYVIVFICAGVFPVYTIHVLLGESLRLAILLGVIYRVVYMLNMTWTVNSLAHYSGDKPFDSKSGATENFICGFLSLGEGFHNYHHAFPHDYRASPAKDLRNPTTYFINFCSKMGWATDLQKPSDEIIQKRALRTGDGSYVTSNDKMSTNALIEKYAGQFMFLVLFLTL